VAKANRCDAEARKACCMPSSERVSSIVEESRPQLKGEKTDASRLGDMVTLPGGAFLMGTDFPEAFLQEGETPVRSVTLHAFAIDRCPVTTDRFAGFIAETGYQTDAERFGWSFVFGRIYRKRSAAKHHLAKSRSKTCERIGQIELLLGAL